MYFYIFEPPRSSKERVYFEKIRDIAREFSIYGEAAQASPARTPEELTQIAVGKNYTTIVAVGSDEHVNRVASQLIVSTIPFPVALGVVSTDPVSILYERWGFKQPEEACEVLKFRKLEKFDAGLIEPQHYFITSARIECKKPSRITLEVDRWKAEALIDRLEVSNNLYILLEKFTRESSAVRAALNWIVGKEKRSADRSIFKGRVIRISSYEPQAVLIGSEVVARTPVNIYRKLNALNIICKRDKFTLEKPMSDKEATAKVSVQVL